MKGKLALLALLSTVVTVGSVYATWTFAETNATTATAQVGITMASKDSATEKGTISIQSSLTLFLDDQDNNHKPEFIAFTDSLGHQGNVTITFIPAATASAEVKANGIDIQFYITSAVPGNTSDPLPFDTWQYNGNTIFNITYSSANPLHLSATTADIVDGNFVWTLTFNQLGMLLHDDFKDTVIDSTADYNELEAILTSRQFILNAQECTTVHS